MTVDVVRTHVAQPERGYAWQAGATQCNDASEIKVMGQNDALFLDCLDDNIVVRHTLQALVTLNDPVYLECASALAKRARDAGGVNEDDWIRWVFVATAQRAPSNKSSARLNSLYLAAIGEYRNDAAGVKDLAAVQSGPGAYVDKIFGGQDNVEIVFDRDGDLPGMCIVRIDRSPPSPSSDGAVM